MEKLKDKLWGILKNSILPVLLFAMVFVFVIDWNNLKTIDYVFIISTIFFALATLLNIVSTIINERL
ncbi:hypothetical protein [Bacillus wiedmannii]|uniref:hypothetical protein n=1 Tax=Bacillus wiedmannii TaxID=1890302 RepID=UPI000BF11C2E|nr:hypothetical protein [Bacillus wiedmannii]PEO20208.1 hypothetical protein CN546_02255 [Bacillus wiedmannii]